MSRATTPEAAPAPATATLVDPARGLTPAQIVLELNRHVVGQGAAKRAVAIALRNRWRRQRVQGAIREDILPNNILLIGPTGVGKTEIARRLARLAGAPFLKIEASKFTEVGYVGRDVESMIRDLVEVGIAMVREEHSREVARKAEGRAEERLLDLLRTPEDHTGRERYGSLLRERKLEGVEVEIEVKGRGIPIMGVMGPGAPEEVQMNLPDSLADLFRGRPQKKRMPVSEARRRLVEEETDALLDRERIVSEAIDRVQTSGIVFLDEMDKIVAAREGARGPDVSREGVQRDLLPIVEGSNVTTKHGVVKTDHVLFIGAGAFYGTKPSDLIPELQGRFPIRVELSSLSEEDFVRILTEPESALLRQYQAILATEGVDLTFTPEAVREVAGMAVRVNQGTEDIGARRLQTILSALLEDVLFEVPAPGSSGAPVLIDAARVRATLESIVSDADVRSYIL